MWKHLLYVHHQNCDFFLFIELKCMCVCVCVCVCVFNAFTSSTTDVTASKRGLRSADERKEPNVPLVSP